MAHQFVLDNTSNANETFRTGFTVTPGKEVLASNIERQISRMYAHQLEVQQLKSFKNDIDILLEYDFKFDAEKKKEISSYIDESDHEHLKIVFPDYFVNTESELIFDVMGQVFTKLGIKFDLINDEKTLIPTIIINHQHLKNHLESKESFIMKFTSEFKLLRDKELERKKEVPIRPAGPRAAFPISALHPSPTQTGNRNSRSDNNPYNGRKFVDFAMEAFQTQYRTNLRESAQSV